MPNGTPIFHEFKSALTTSAGRSERNPAGLRRPHCVASTEAETTCSPMR